MSGSLPVPNDRPECRCVLNPDTVPDGFTEVQFTNSPHLPPEGGRVAYDPACPHHGAILRALRPQAGSYSIG